MEIKELYVSSDTDKDFRTVSDAVAAARGYSGMKVIIYIAAGVYNERICVEQDNVSLIGAEDGVTKITYSHYANEVMPEGDKRGTFRTASVFIDSDDFYASNITFSNEAGQGDIVGQAIAMYADGDRLIFENCRFDGFQDTLFTAPLPKKEIQPGGFKGPKQYAPRKVGRHLYKDCYIAGNIDFIFGGAVAYFENCEIFSKKRGEDISGRPQGYIIAPSTFEGQKYGYVFNKCRFTSDCPDASCYLGRPWRNFAKCVIINSDIGAHIRGEGWDDWNKKEAWDTMFFAEYNNSGAGAGMARAPYVRMLTSQQAREYTRENVLGF